MNTVYPVHMVNGNEGPPRVRSSENCEVAECGCAWTFTPYRFVQMCDPDYQEWHALHVAANALEAAA